MPAPLHAVTGAFGYSGQYLARELLDAGQRVLTLTNSPHRGNPFGNQIEVAPFHFDQPDKLVRSLENVEVLYNTYWVRFNSRWFRHEEAVRNTLILFDAARKAGVQRIVHVSITNPSLTSPLEYFRGKAQLEQALQESGMSYAILRPTVLFGKEDILINNIAWALRRLPVVGVFGDGNYRLQPIYVEDLARLAVEQGRLRDNSIIEAIGPESFSYRELVAVIGKTLGIERPVVSVPPELGYWACRVLGWLVRDRIITREEIRGLMADLLYVEAPPAGTTRLTDWMQAHRETLGRHYTSELARRRDRLSAYGSN